MFVIEVTPLIRGTVVEKLSYYSSLNHEPGSIITVPLRSKQVQAIVTDSRPVSRAKTALKAATFSLRKLNNEQNVSAPLPENIVKTAKELSKLYPASIGSILYALLPPDIRNGSRTYPQTTSQIGEENPTPSIYTGLTSDRFLYYKSRIREAFAHRASVLLIVPNSTSVKIAADYLRDGIEKRVITFSSIHTKKQFESSYLSFNDLTNAKLIIATPNFAFLDRHDITTIIVEECGSTHYKARTRPYLDYRTILKTYAKISNKAIIFGDTLPPTKYESKRRDELFETVGEHQQRLHFSSNFELVKHNDEPGSEFTIITPALAENIKLTLSNKGRVFLFAPRKGLSPLVLCFDCGHIFRCVDSGAPYSLLRTGHGDEEKRWFVCSTSGKRVRAADTCPDCGSWRLREQGVGIQRVEDTVRKLFPKVNILKLDHETATTHKKAQSIMNDFYNQKQSILIGTMMTLPYLNKPVDMIAVTSYEALRSIPTWQAEEQTFSTILKLREKTAKDFLIQLRTEEDHLLSLAKNANINQFYEEEIEIRKAVKYPPFSHFILLTYTGSLDQVENLTENIQTLLADYKIHNYGTPLPKNNHYTKHTLIRVAEENWPDPLLMDMLRTLPPQIKMEVDPLRIV